ncbi:MAG: hypothetical protein ABI811_17500 [Acidobacteriota bacterium]
MRWKPSYLILGTALFAFAWVVTRACVQAISIDEATTYLGYVQYATPDHWRVNSNNHVLNSGLMRLVTSLFGLSAFTIRMPAVIGAGLYVWAAVRWCKLASTQWFVQWPLLLCLVYNPFVFDYLVAARGYGMAVAFLMLALVNAAEWLYQPLERRRSLEAMCGISSVCLALSFASNFSFAFVDAAALIGLLSMVWVQRTSAMRLIGMLAIPGVAVIYATVWWTARHFGQGELWYGAATIGESLGSLLDATLYQLNPDLANPQLLPLFAALRPFLLPMLLLSALAIGSLTWARKEWRPKFAAVLALIAVAAFGMHWLGHQYMGLLLPKDRTGLYIVTLLTAAAGMLAGVPALSISARAARIALLGTMFALGLYFVMCLRLNHFKEWPWNANADKVYARLACMNHEHVVRYVSSVWMQEAVLNVYRLSSGHETLAKIIDLREERAGTEVWVTNYLFDQPLMAEKGLKIIYHDETEATIAVTPELAARMEASVCLQFPQ